jgi:putative lumazine-binding protein
MVTSPADKAAIEGVVLDYFEGWFDGDAVRMERALHPELAKRSLGDEGRIDSTTAKEMIDATTLGIGKKWGAGDRRIEVQIEDVYDTIANVTVRSAPYREYLQLLRTPDGWKIANALWQLTEPG